MTVMETLKEKAGSVIGSANSLQKTTIDILEQSSNAALESCNYYNSVGIKQLHTATSVTDMESMRNLVGETLSLSSDIVKHLIGDARKSVELGMQARARLSSVLNRAVKSESDSDAPPKAATAKHKAAAV